MFGNKYNIKKPLFLQKTNSFLMEPRRLSDIIGGVISGSWKEIVFHKVGFLKSKRYYYYNHVSYLLIEIGDDAVVTTINERFISIPRENIKILKHGLF